MRDLVRAGLVPAGAPRARLRLLLPGPRRAARGQGAARAPRARRAGAPRAGRAGGRAAGGPALSRGCASSPMGARSRCATARPPGSPPPARSCSTSRSTTWCAASRGSAARATRRRPGRVAASDAARAARGLRARARPRGRGSRGGARRLPPARSPSIPALVDACVNLGRLAHEAGDAREAARLYHLALERSPEDPIVHFNLALALEDLRAPERALDALPARARHRPRLRRRALQPGRAVRAARPRGAGPAPLPCLQEAHERLSRRAAVLAGTSGWSYEEWKGPFYPEDARLARHAALLRASACPPSRSTTPSTACRRRACWPPGRRRCRRASASRSRPRGASRT